MTMTHRRQHLASPIDRLAALPWLIALLALPGMASAQRLAPGETLTSASLTAVGQLKADLDSEGKFDWYAMDLSVQAMRQFDAAWSAGLSLRYAAEHWSFDSPSAFGAQAPWTDIHRPGIGFNLGYQLAPDLSLMFAPQFEWAYETGARTSDALSYGAVFGATKVFSPSLVVGLGLGVFRQIDDTRYFPFVIVNWQITEALRLSNPLRAGPAGSAGLELSYKPAPGWEAGVGAAYREYRFRLSNDGPVPDGLGQNRGVPIFARLSRSFGPVGQVTGRRRRGPAAGGQPLRHHRAVVRLRDRPLHRPEWNDPLLARPSARCSCRSIGARHCWVWAWRQRSPRSCPGTARRGARPAMSTPG